MLDHGIFGYRPHCCGTRPACKPRGRRARGAWSQATQNQFFPFNAPSAGARMSSKARPSNRKREREQHKRQRQQRKAERAAQRREQRLTGDEPAPNTDAAVLQDPAPSTGADPRAVNPPGAV